MQELDQRRVVLHDAEMNQKKHLVLVGILLAVAGVGVLTVSPGLADRAYQRKIVAQTLVMDEIHAEINRASRSLDAQTVLEQSSRINEQTSKVYSWNEERAGQKKLGTVFGVVLLLAGVGLTIFGRSFQSGGTSASS